MRCALILGSFILGVNWMAVAEAQEATVTAIEATTPEIQTGEWAAEWWMPRHEQKLAEKMKLGDVDLVMIGDSITHGWEDAGKETWNKYYAKHRALNIGFSGDRTEQVLWRLDHGAVDDISPKLAVIMIGTNNTGHRQDPPNETADGIKGILKRLRQKLPGTKLLVLAIFPRGSDSQDPLRKLNEQINQRIAKLADDKHIFFLDINHTFLAGDGLLSDDVMPDFLHPNEKGYALWAEAMEPTIARLMP